MDENRNGTPRLSLVAPAPHRTARRLDLAFPLPRRHRRLLTSTGAAAAVLLCALSTGTVVQDQLRQAPTAAGAATVGTAAGASAGAAG